MHGLPTAPKKGQRGCLNTSVVHGPERLVVAMWRRGLLAQICIGACRGQPQESQHHSAPRADRRGKPVLSQFKEDWLIGGNTATTILKNMCNVLLQKLGPVRTVYLAVAGMPCLHAKSLWVSGAIVRRAGPRIFDRWLPSDTQGERARFSVASLSRRHPPPIASVPARSRRLSQPRRRLRK